MYILSFSSGAAARPILPATPRTRIWSAPGTCGAFLQGRLDGVDFLINSPIDRFARATVQSNGGDGVTVADPATHSRVAHALALLADRVDFARGFEVTVESELPQCKGMASSTADIVAALGAALAQTRDRLSAADLARLLVQVEPSDCTHVDGVGHVGHLCGRIFGTFPAPSDLRVLILDCGDPVDTASFDRSHAHHIYARYETRLRFVLSLALRSLALRDSAGLARAATQSSRLSQLIMPKQGFDDVLAIAAEEGALGVNCAHSGSVLGILYRPQADRGSRLRAAVTRAFGTDIPIIGDHRFIAGGVHASRSN